MPGVVVDGELEHEQRRGDREHAVAERLDSAGALVHDYASPGASSRPISRTGSRSVCSRCCSITRSQPAASYSRRRAATSSTEPISERSRVRRDPVVERHVARDTAVQLTRALERFIVRCADEAAVIVEKRIVAGSRPARSHAAVTLARTAANSSGDLNGVLYSSAKRAAGSAVPRVPLPPTSNGGCGSLHGFRQRGSVLERVVLAAKVDALLGPEPVDDLELLGEHREPH